MCVCGHVCAKHGDIWKMQPIFLVHFTHLWMGQNLLWMGQRNPNHQLIDGKHPMIYRISSIQGGEGFRWPIHSIIPIWLWINTYTYHF
jgi:hypothetical protein